ncbi:RluA family pseudouridine synthase [Marinobacteraceae bacterium S3BR75-40.1]
MASGKPTHNGKRQSTSSVRWVTIDEEHEEQRLDNFLLAQWRGVPKSVVYRVIRKGEVRVNRSRAKPDTRLAKGDEVRIPPVKRPEKSPAPVPGSRIQAMVEAAIVYEDDHLIVVNKPHGLAVHGGSGLQFGLIEALRAARPKARFLELVHRLDRDTSGLVMVAKRRPALRKLQEQIRGRSARKVYHALVAGGWPDSLDQVDAPLLRSERGGERIVVVDERGKDSLTRFRVLERFTGYTLVEAVPVTGRTHQIRVHCAFAGHPIAGDPKYMDEASVKIFRRESGERLMLHAAGLGIVLPGSERETFFEAPYDEAFEQFLRRLSKRSGA